MNAQAQAAFQGRAVLLTVVGLAVGLVAVGVAKETEVIDGQLAKRMAGVTIGAVLVVTGNALPKLVGPIDPQQGARTAAPRFAGWAFVLAGVANIAAWLTLPMENVMLVSSLVGLSAFTLVACAWLWRTRGQRLKGRLAPAPEGPDTPTYHESTVTRIALVFILHAVFWVLAMFLADTLWGDRVAQWMAVVFALSTGFYLSWWRGKLLRWE